MSALVFTIGLNGYGDLYRDCITSQHRYARRLGVEHVAVTRPFIVRERALTAWLKLTLLRDALAAGHDWVAFVDSDARIAKAAPDFRGIYDHAHDVYAARGRSGRLNSGVIVARNSVESRVLMDRLVQSATEPVPEADRANLKYENGNFIHIARTSPTVAEMPLSWNNTYDPDLDDHIRHYTGDLRRQHVARPLDRRLFAARQKLSSPAKKAPESRDPEFISRLEQLTRQVVSRHSAFSASRAR